MSRTRIISLAFLVTVISAAAAFAAAPTHLWSLRAGGVPDDQGNSVVFDGAGNVYVTGGFQGTADFGGGNLVSAGSTDIFLAKYDANGAHEWSQRFGDNSGQAGVSLAIDGSGNVYFAGGFSGSVDLGGGVLASAGLNDVCLAKFDSNGNHVWSRRFGGIEGESVSPIAVDGAGNVYATGFFLNVVDFGGGSLASAGFDDTYLVKYDTNGAHQWSKRFGTADHESGTALAVDMSGNVYAAGIFADSLDLGGAILQSIGNQDIYLAKFSTVGTHQWSRSFGSTMLQYCTSLAVDASGSVYATGIFQDSVDFGGGALMSAGFYDVFLAGYDASGAHQWSQRFGDPGSDLGRALTLDASGNVILAVLFSGTVDFGGGALSAATGGAMLLAGYDASGVHLWSQNYGGAGTGAGVTSLAVSAMGPVCVTGSFVGNVDFGGGTLTSQAGRNDMFVAAFEAGPASSAGDTRLHLELSVGNHPNPFNPSTTVTYTLPVRDVVTVTIFDVRGARVTTLVDAKVRDAGTHSVVWNGRRRDGAAVPSGTYFASVEQRGVVRSHKLVLLK